MKILMSLLLIGLTLLAKGYTFEEERYIYSIDKTVVMHGSITFDKAGMHIDYSEPEERHIVYNSLFMDVLDADGDVVQHVDLSKEPMMKIYLDFIHKLYRGNYDALAENFKITKTQSVVMLAPIAPIDKVITSVVVHKNPKGLSQIRTKMSNGDVITLHISQ